jgi:hypothetical protein
MITCPKCESTLEEKTAVCECGAILFGEVTNVSGWETETIVHVAQVTKKRVVPAVAVALAVLLAVAALSWPRFSRSFVTDGDAPANVEDAVAQTPARSDLIPTDDLIRSDLDVNADFRSGAFEFTSKHTPTHTSRRTSPRSEIASNSQATEETQPNTLDAELLRDPTKNNTSAVDPADCKPEVASALKRPEPPQDVNETRFEKKTSASSYILGPRGGCFIVTVNGGKKYVDRALCSPSTAAARQ